MFVLPSTARLVHTVLLFRLPICYRVCCSDAPRVHMKVNTLVFRWGCLTHQTVFCRIFKADGHQPNPVKLLPTSCPLNVASKTFEAASPDNLDPMKNIHKSTGVKQHQNRRRARPQAPDTRGWARTQESQQARPSSNGPGRPRGTRLPLPARRHSSPA